MDKLKVCYRKLRKYTYQLMEDYVVQIDIKPTQNLEYKFVSLNTRGALTTRQYYSWDGPSGPTIDTRDFMRGSLVHDALYQLMRLSALDCGIYRKRADQILVEICRQDGMPGWRAWYVYWAVRIFATKSASPQKEPEVQLIRVP
jgi:hypothetical protein